MCGFCRINENGATRTIQRFTKDGQILAEIYLEKLADKKEVLTMNMNGKVMEKVIEYCPFCGRKL